LGGRDARVRAVGLDAEPERSTFGDPVPRTGGRRDWASIVQGVRGSVLHWGRSSVGLWVVSLRSARLACWAV